jgi:AcrR family transcriptional regulator
MDSGTGRDAGGHSARERILDSSLHLFAEKGFTGATTKEISAKAGVNEVTLFRHFGSKKALFASVIQERSHLGEIEARMSVDTDVPVDDLFERNAKAVLAALKASRHLSMMILGDAWRMPKMQGMTCDPNVEKSVDLVAGLMTELMAAGKAREVDPRVAARAFIGMVQSYYVTRHLLGGKEPGPEEDERVISGFVGIFLDGVRREVVR